MGLRLAVQPDIRLQPADLLLRQDNSPSEGEIIPLSGVSKSGAGRIIQSDGGGVSSGRQVGADGVELQPLTVSINTMLQSINFLQGMRKFLSSCMVNAGQLSLALLQGDKPVI